MEFDNLIIEVFQTFYAYMAETLLQRLTREILPQTSIVSTL